MIVSKFKTQHVGFTGEWETGEVYYAGDLSSIDLSKDSRFCEVKNRRKQAEFIGLFDKPDFLALKQGRAEESEFVY